MRIDVTRNKAVYKYELNFTDGNIFTTLRLPLTIEVASVAMQSGVPHIWLLHTVPELANIFRPEQFAVIGTGYKFESGWSPVGTIFDSPFEWHVLRYLP